MKAPKNRYRIIRGEKANYRVHKFPDQEARDAAAKRYAEEDGESVLTELWDESHPQDSLNNGWACDGAALPFEDVLGPLDFDPDPGDRIAAKDVEVGDRVTVWAFEGLENFLYTQAWDHQGIVERVVQDEDIPTRGSTHAARSQGMKVVLIYLEDGRELAAVDTAKTTRHHEKEN